MNDYIQLIVKELLENRKRYKERIIKIEKELSEISKKYGLSITLEKEDRM